MINRSLSKKLKHLASKFPVVSVLGPRQSGKTTLVRDVFSKMDYVSLEDLDNREFAIKDPRGFLSTYSNGAVIDEAQRAPDIFSYIQTEVDKSQKAPRFILTGSQNILLHEHISQTLAGRVAILKLLPLSCDELKKAGYKFNNLSDYIFTGFYPRIYDKKIAPTDWYHNYIQTYVERDVRLIKNIPDLNTFQRFIKLCAGRIGQVLNLTSLGNDCGITHNTAKAWISILESSYVVFLLKPYFRNFNKRLIKMPKLYFYDTGLACSLLGIKTKGQLASHYSRGSLFESFVISEILKYKFNRGVEHNCYFWRDKTGNEVDCVIEEAGSLLKIEIKSAKTVADDFFAGIKYFQKITGKAPGKSYIVYGGGENQKRNIADLISWKDVISIFV